MFGYINVYRDELTDEEKKAYQAYYCGLCRKLRMDCGVKGQMLLNYDMTFLVVLLTGLYELTNEVSQFHCAMHPTKKQTAWTNDVTDYAAEMNVLLGYYNLLDDWNDDKSFTKKTYAGILKKDYERIAAKYPRQMQAAELYMQQIAGYEKSREPNIDVVAGITGEMLGEIVAWKEDEWYEELKTLGFYMGKFIYLMDAYEDMEKDEKSNSYNPLINLKAEHEGDYETLCKLMLTSMMAECAKSFERLPILLHAGILRNVLYSGVWSKYEYIQLKKKKRKKK